ncbi:hypothetical protein LSH36_2210g00000 [Paralvinella palmiformis]|uniref:Carboxypeptidase activation peptide domain-containing protein n=1 Tax=Paralvinella palmiformis TaxID=53620 RepID=A0AAD9MNS9_9ANNE|nr:hypothetical protein LSH36_2210g00000 [Paralvinella palmiformis]
MWPDGSKLWHNVIALLSFIVMVTLTTALSWQRNYDGSQVFRIQIPTNEIWSQFYARLLHLSNINMLNNRETFQTIDIWRYPMADEFVDVCIHGSDVIQSQHLLNNLGLKYHVTVNDVNSLIIEEGISNLRRRRRSLTEKSIIGYYPKYDETPGLASPKIVSPNERLPAQVPQENSGPETAKQAGRS